jgi:hypothetical protein
MMTVLEIAKLPRTIAAIAPALKLSAFSSSPKVSGLSDLKPSSGLELTTYGYVS